MHFRMELNLRMESHLRNISTKTLTAIHVARTLQTAKDMDKRDLTAHNYLWTNFKQSIHVRSRFQHGLQILRGNRPSATPLLAVLVTCD